MEISFGGPSWQVSPADFQFQPTGMESDYCYGAFYAIPTSSNSPQWIIGDTFLACAFILAVPPQLTCVMTRKTCTPYSAMTPRPSDLRLCRKQRSQ